MREIKFRGMGLSGGWFVGNLAITQQEVDHIEAGSYITNSVGIPFAERVRPETVGQYTGIKDRAEKEIYEGDIVLERRPERDVQTHYGKNIPTPAGEYTEPLEPIIVENKHVVAFDFGMFQVGKYEGTDVEAWPLYWLLISYDLKSAQEGFSGHWSEYGKRFVWDDPEDGDLQYLLAEYKLADEAALIAYLGVEVIGNIHEAEK